jgi:hypothetical protein
MGEGGGGWTYRDRAPKKQRIVTFLEVLICRVMMTWMGKSIRQRSVKMFIAPTTRQKAVYTHISIPHRF